MRIARILFVTLLLSFGASSLCAQTFPTPDYFRRMVVKSPLSMELPPPENLRDFVQEGKLRLSLVDTIKLTLKNNTEIKINSLSVEAARTGIPRAYRPFDPVLTASFDVSRATSPPTSSTLESTAIVSTLSQPARFGYTQTFFTGTQFNVDFSASKFATNSSTSIINPSLNASLGFSFSQPLLRGCCLFTQRAPILIARRSLNQSRSNFEASVNTSIQRAVDQYWGVVQARENLNVLRRSLEQAEATYAQNKRALELGALPPLDIYRSESQVASRRVSVIQAEYDLKQLEDDLRRTIGADLDPSIRVLDLDLTERAEPSGELLTMDSQAALAQAMQRRPELEAFRQQIANDDAGIRLAHNALQPDLSVGGAYSSAGNNVLQVPGVPPTVARGGLTDTFGQLAGFDFTGYTISLNLRLPIKNRAAEADLANSEIGKKRSLYQLRQTEQSITLETRNAVHDLEQAKLSMGAARIARDLSQKNLEAEQRKYELGAQTIFFVLDAQTQLAQSELSLLQANISYQRAVTALERATGQLLERHRVQIADVMR